MRYKIKSLTIAELVNLVKQERLNLKPYYQRNDIWSKNDQVSLISSIKKGYPLPSFFIYERSPGKFELVDGQQRTRTILRYLSEQIEDSGLSFTNKSDRDAFLSYELSITEIFEVQNDKEIEDFYVLVNKRGKHLTSSELHKAEFADTNFLACVEGLLEYQKLIDLNLFTDSASKRMSDREFIEELAATLIYGIQDKKKIIERIYIKDIDANEQVQIETGFKSVINRIHSLNGQVPINKTRYKQKSDFYTLFCFISANVNESQNLLEAQYRSLVKIGPYISPSQDDCPPLKNYALNCVSQSNSKDAREERFGFFNQLLLNREKDISKSPTLSAIANFLENQELFEIEFEEVDGFTLIKG